MKTICIKTNNEIAKNYLLENLKHIHLDDIYISSHKFKIFNNIFIHYKGENIELFLSSISIILSSLVFDIYEKNITKKIFYKEYFYFENIEQKEIFKNLDKNSFEDVRIVCRKGKYFI